MCVAGHADPSVLQGYQSWLKEHGVEAPDVRLLHDGEQGYHVEAKKMLERGAVVLSIPFEAVFSAVSSPTMASLLEDTEGALDTASQHVDQTQAHTQHSGWVGASQKTRPGGVGDDCPPRTRPARLTMVLLSRGPYASSAPAGCRSWAPFLQR